MTYDTMHSKDRYHGHVLYPFKLLDLPRRPSLVGHVCRLDVNTPANNALQLHVSTSLKPRLHDTTCCQTGCQTGLTIGCIVYTNIRPVVKPV